jgi:hypothetical protein
MAVGIVVDAALEDGSQADFHVRREVFEDPVPGAFVLPVRKARSLWPVQTTAWDPATSLLDNAAAWNDSTTSPLSRRQDRSLIRIIIKDVHQIGK